MNFPIISILSALSFLPIALVFAIPPPPPPRNSPEELWDIDSGSPKYFNEPGNGDIFGHYDARYFLGQPVPDAERRKAQHDMINAYLQTFYKLDIETWLAHGTLLGWWWNGAVLPWDGDLDVQVWVHSLEVMAQKYNGTTHIYNTISTNEAGEETQVFHNYLLDINPNYVERTRGNWMNVIDARWVDQSNGLFIDITGLSETKKGIWSCKNYHEYHKNNLLPLLETTFEGTRALVPSAYENILKKEYQSQALTVTKYEDHYWDDEEQIWKKEL